MGLFSKKPSEADTSQDAEIQALKKTLNNLIVAFNTHVKNSDAWFSYLNKTFFPQFNALVKRVTDGEKLDAQQQAAIDGLVNTAISIQTAAKETSEAKE